MKKIFAVLSIAILASGCGPTIRLTQPVVIGQPGTIYQSTEALYSVDVVNNSGHVGDVLVGQTVVYKGVPSGEIVNIGFECGGALIIAGTRFNLRPRKMYEREDYIRFRSHQPGFEVDSKRIRVECEKQEKDEWEIRRLKRRR